MSSFASIPPPVRGSRATDHDDYPDRRPSGLDRLGCRRRILDAIAALDHAEAEAGVKDRWLDPPADVACELHTSDFIPTPDYIARRCAAIRELKDIGRSRAAVAVFRPTKYNGWGRVL